MPHRAANDFAQHVAAPFVRRHNAVADQESSRAAVVGKNPQRCIAFRRRAILFVRKLAGKIDQRTKKVRIVVADLALQHRREAFKARTRIDRRVSAGGA